MKIRIILVLGMVIVVAAMMVGWKFVATKGAAYDKHAYNGIYNSGVGHPYEEFIRELRKIAESGDTNRLMTVLRRAEQHSSDIYAVWLYDDHDAYRKSLDEILK